MRRKLKEAGIANHKVVFSTEKPIKPQQNEEIAGFSDENKPFKKSVPGSLVFVPNVAGYLLAYETFRCLISPSE